MPVIFMMVQIANMLELQTTAQAAIASGKEAQDRYEKQMKELGATLEKYKASSAVCTEFVIIYFLFNS